MATDRLLDAIDELAACPGEAALSATAPFVLARLLGGEVAAATRIDVGRGTALLDLYPGIPRFVGPTRHTAETLSDNPIIRHWAKGADSEPHRVSDLIGRREWRGTAAFANVLGPMGTPYLMGIPLFKPAAGGPSYAVARSGRDFTDEDLVTARILQGALLMLHRRMEPPRGFPILSAGMTAREQQILELLALGLSGAQISRRLGLAQGTVRKHLEKAYSKLDVHDRLTAVNVARELGLISCGSRVGR